MASVAKHLSTHVYFHMERGRKGGGTSTSNYEGGGGSGAYGGCHHAKSSRNHFDGGNSRDTSERSRLGRMGVYGYRREGGGGRIGSEVGLPAGTESGFRSDRPLREFDYFEYFCQSPYVQSPEVPAREKTRRRFFRRSRDKYEEDYSARPNRRTPFVDHYANSTYGHPGTSSPLHEFREPSPPDPPPPPAPPPDVELYTRNTKRSTRAECAAYEPEPPPVSELDGIEQDCFIIPAHLMPRFMPYQPGNSSSVESQNLNTLEVTDPHICIVLDFGENAAHAQNLVSPTTTVPSTPKEWMMNQMTQQIKTFDLVKETQAAIEGVLLMNVERNSQFPFVTYLVLNTNHTNPRRVISELIDHTNESSHDDQLHHIAGYEEVATIARPPVDILPKRPTTPKTGYIISAFRVFPGEDREKLERSWLLWTGARLLYKRLPRHLGLRRITFHKKVCPERGLTYVLLCECTALVDHVTDACVIVDQLRARCCGYTGLYRVIDVF